MVIIKVLLNYRFDPTIWGTVSDWVLTIATIFTLYFIYRTFQSQLVVQKSQVDLTQIEIDKYVKDDKPYFLLEEFEFTHLESRKEDPNVVIHLTKKGNLEALGFKPTSNPPCEIEILADIQQVISTDITIMYFFKTNHQGKESLRFISMLFFKDRYGNNYRQVLTIMEVSNKMEAYLSSPSLNDRASEIFNEIK